ncbi:MAG: hypothetical protein WC354_04425, partial [Candidatus Omnitrophota bacterium]
ALGKHPYEVHRIIAAQAQRLEDTWGFTSRRVIKMPKWTKHWVEDNYDISGSHECVEQAYGLFRREIRREFPQVKLTFGHTASCTFHTNWKIKTFEPYVMVPVEHQAAVKEFIDSYIAGKLSIAAVISEFRHAAGQYCNQDYLGKEGLEIFTGERQKAALLSAISSLEERSKITVTDEALRIMISETVKYGLTAEELRRALADPKVCNYDNPGDFLSPDGGEEEISRLIGAWMSDNNIKDISKLITFIRDFAGKGTLSSFYSVNAVENILETGCANCLDRSIIMVFGAITLGKTAEILVLEFSDSRSNKNHALGILCDKGKSIPVELTVKSKDPDFTAYTRCSYERMLGLPLAKGYLIKPEAGFVSQINRVLNGDASFEPCLMLGSILDGGKRIPVAEGLEGLKLLVGQKLSVKCFAPVTLFFDGSSGVGKTFFSNRIVCDGDKVVLFHADDFISRDLSFNFLRHDYALIAWAINTTIRRNEARLVILEGYDILKTGIDADIKVKIVADMATRADNISNNSSRCGSLVNRVMTSDKRYDLVLDNSFECRLSPELSVNFLDGGRVIDSANNNAGGSFVFGLGVGDNNIIVYSSEYLDYLIRLESRKKMCAPAMCLSEKTAQEGAKPSPGLYYRAPEPANNDREITELSSLLEGLTVPAGMQQGIAQQVASINSFPSNI